MKDTRLGGDGAREETEVRSSLSSEEHTMCLHTSVVQCVLLREKNSTVCLRALSRPALFSARDGCCSVEESKDRFAVTSTSQPKHCLDVCVLRRVRNVAGRGWQKKRGWKMRPGQKILRSCCALRTGVSGYFGHLFRNPLSCACTIVQEGVYSRCTVACTVVWLRW